MNVAEKADPARYAQTSGTAIKLNKGTLIESFLSLL